jgi:archaellin
MARTTSLIKMAMMMDNAKIAKIEPITTTLSKGRQTVDFNQIEIYTHNDGRVQKLKYDISSDSNAFQCHARVHVWDTINNQWNYVYSIPYSLMKTEPTMYAWPSTRPVTASLFQADRDELRRVALATVF